MFGSGYCCVLGFSAGFWLLCLWDLVFGIGYYCVLG